MFLLRWMPIIGAELRIWDIGMLKSYLSYMMLIFLSIIPAYGQQEEFEKTISQHLRIDLEELKELAHIEEIDEVLLIYRKKLFDHADDYEKAVSTRQPYLVFSQGFKDVRSDFLLKEVTGFYLQKYYDDQLAKLLIRLDRQRSSVSKMLASHGFRVSITQEAIQALHILAGIHNLKIETETGYVEKMVTFFSQKAPAKDYFYKVFAEIKSKDQQQQLLDVGLEYLMLRYQVDRNLLSKFLGYFGLKASQTKEAVQALIMIAQDLNIKLKEDYLIRLNHLDQELIINVAQTMLAL